MESNFQTYKIQELELINMPLETLADIERGYITVSGLLFKIVQIDVILGEYGFVIFKLKIVQEPTNHEA